MTTQRDELAAEIADVYLSNMGAGPLAGKVTQFDLAEAILAAGYRKPRTITTVEWGVRYSDSGHTSRRSSQAVAEQAAAEHNQLDMTTWVQSFTMTVVSRTVSEWEPTA